MIARMAATARTIPKTYASLAGSGFGAMCPLLATRQMSPYRTLEGLNGKMCERLHTLLVVQKMQGGKKPQGTGDHFGPGQSVLSFIAFFLIGELLFGNLSETVVVVGNAPHDGPSFLVCHLIGNRASFLCTKAPVRRIQNEVSGHQLTSTSVPLAEKGPDH